MNMPNIPPIWAAIINGKRRTRIVALIRKTGDVNEASAANATMINRKLLVIEASTAAVPSTMPPTIPIVCPILEGNLAPASRNSSITSSIMSTSTNGGKGTLILEEMIVGKKIFDIPCPWYVITATYNGVAKMENTTDVIRISLNTEPMIQGRK